MLFFNVFDLDRWEYSKASSILKKFLCRPGIYICFHVGSPPFPIEKNLCKQLSLYIVSLLAYQLCDSIEGMDFEGIQLYLAYN
jgi:hypothetical protein